MNDKQVLVKNLKQLQKSSKLSLNDYSYKVQIDLDRYQAMLLEPDTILFSELEQIATFHAVPMKQLFIKDFF